MNVDIEFNPAAFKHNVTEIGIRNAVENIVYDKALPGDDNKYLLLGYDGNANLLEIIYNVLDEHTIYVFHAMKCRKAYRSLVNFRLA
jgi:hypothetical protein